MTALIVIGCIVGFIALLLSFSVTVYVHITEEVNVSVGALGFKKKIDSEEFQKKQENKKKPKKKKKNKKTPDQPKEQKPKEKVTQKTFGETVEFALMIIKSIAKPSKRLLSHIRITCLSLQMTVCDEDADETAIQFGQICTGIYALLGHLDQLLTLKVKKVEIRPDFVSDEAQYDIYFKVKLRLCHILGSAIGMIFNLIVNTIKTKNQQQEQNEQEIRQQESLKKSERVMSHK